MLKINYFLLTVVFVVGSFKFDYAIAEDKKVDLEWWKKAIIYQVYPRSFKDTNNDGIGDLNGVASQLEYLKSIGVTAIWLNPIYPSGGQDNGYDVSSYVDIDPVYGSMNDFRNLVKKAHELGIYVIMDLIPNHTSNKHNWFIQSNNNNSDANPYKDYYVWHPSNDKSKPPNNWLSIFGGPAWTWSESRKQWYLRHFLSEQPDLNYRNPAVRNELKKIITFWLQEMDIDGLRIDAYANLVEDEKFRNEPIKNDPSVDLNNLRHPDLIHIYTQNQPETIQNLIDWRKLTEQIEITTGKKKMLVTEVYDDMKTTMEYCNYKGAPAAYFPFNFQFIQLRNDTNPLFKQQGVPFNPIVLKSLIDPWFKYLPKGCWSNWVLGNHDNSRLASRIGVEYVDHANVLNLLLGGTTVTYYGEEIGMTDLGRDKIPYEDCQDEYGKRQGPQLYSIYSRDYERTPMQWSSAAKNAEFTSDSVKPWLPINQNYLNINVKKQMNDKYSHLDIYKKLATLKQEPSFQRGDFEYLLVNNQIFSFKRMADDEIPYVVVMNLSDEDLYINLHSETDLPEQVEIVMFFGKNQTDSLRMESMFKVGDKIPTKYFQIGSKNCFILTY